MYVSIHTHTHTLPLPLPQSKQAINKSTKGSQRLHHIYKRFHDHIGIILQNTLVNTNFQGKLQGSSSSYCFPLIYLIAQFDKILIIYFNIHKICSNPFNTLEIISYKIFIVRKWINKYVSPLHARGSTNDSI